MDNNAPDIIGPSDHDLCERCGDIEPAEVEAVFYWYDGPITFHLCMTCYLELANDSTRTEDESNEYWSKRHDRRGEDD